MHARLKVFFKILNRIRKSLAKTIEAFNKMHASANSRLIRQAQRFQKLEIGTEEISVREN
jgi:DNA anti-recombination protein RmuC